jgi:hypothetical protein
MHTSSLIDTLRAQGWGFAVDGQDLRIRSPKGALTDELRQAIRAEKAAIMTVLAAERQRAQMPPQADDPVAVKVWSEVLGEALWVVADGVPLDAYLGDGKVYTYHELRVLLEHGRGVKTWAPLDIEMEG